MEGGSRGRKRELPAWMRSLHKHSKGQSLKAKGQRLVEGDNRSMSEGSKDKKSSHQVACAGDILAASMPLLEYQGPITYSYQASDCASICEDILDSLPSGDTTVVGFDTEWPVSFSKGGQAKTSLIQMCLKDKCYLFHVAAMHTFPKMLGRLVLDQRLLLVGVNVEGDLWKLARDFDLAVKPLFDRGSVLDVGQLANRKLKSSQRWSLEGLCRQLLRHRLAKEDVVRCGRWDMAPLGHDQQMYAATDAFAGLEIYNELMGT